MRAKILKKINLEGIPSASGIEIAEQKIYIIGDDSPFLYCLDFDYKLISKTKLFTSKDFSTGRIPKLLKPDLECMTILDINNEKRLLIAGSGSKSNRCIAYSLTIPLKQTNNINSVSFQTLYQRIAEIPGIGKINIEALASDEHNIYIFNRAGKIGQNLILMYKSEEFKNFLDLPEKVPQPVYQKYQLPEINNIPSGFSGASVYGDKLFFTASVEDTDDPIKDGQVYGSFVGYLAINPPGSPNTMSELKSYCVIEENNNIYPGKVESIAIYKTIPSGQLIALAVTDNDSGGSELLELELTL